MAKMRHWKQRFDFDADLVFRKRMVIRGWGVDVAAPGDPVPLEMKEHFGKNRMRIWWEGGFIAINDQAEQEAPQLVRARDLVPALSTGSPKPIELGGGLITPPKQSVVSVGGGFYDVTRDGVTTRVRGKKNIPD